MGMASLATFLILLINHIFPSHVYSLMVGFIGNAIFLLPQHFSHTLSLSVSLLSSSLSPFFPFDIKNPGKPFHLIIVLNKLLEVCTQYTDSCGQHTIFDKTYTNICGPIELRTGTVFTTLCFLHNLQIGPIS